MSKYSALGQFLRSVEGDIVKLAFADIERILDDVLPKSAYKHDAWWANSKTEDSHTWAHLWLAAGWQKESHNLAERSVVFRRLTAEMRGATDLLKSLEPHTSETLFDILALANISTADWLYTGRGEPVVDVKANPNYCYNWSFGSETEGFALCMWHDLMAVENDQIIYENNHQDLARSLEKITRDLTFDSVRRSRASQQAARARAFDAAINTSYRKGLPIFAILTAGNRRGDDELGTASSEVKFRTLDPVHWYVHQYNPVTGVARLVRGEKPEGVVGDEGAEFDTVNNGTPDEIQFRAIQTRRGQAKFREALLAAYNRRCAVTGCSIVELLEAAHIRPHAEQPDYSVSNGLLLKADIHTLYDLKLLSIDQRCIVHLAPALQLSEYRHLHGQPLRFGPDRFLFMPSPQTLERRHREFLDKHGLK
ncbi:HNH endonuclease [Janthinobacterium fluminis]|uniref:HNH endonuclease signature motif containing protein n=1 Tax=Janthinobacterium fluminis TaxID=2987524 RepID=A0ABT5K6R1_9BURK|nr:HNH endonuclease signature motif containing protein [Janthinobacterium fluminis]MDC8760682.1 HNH endonuclease signature motif containing protein [Janthinobacterium fluminis]